MLTNKLGELLFVVAGKLAAIGGTSYQDAFCEGVHNPLAAAGYNPCGRDFSLFALEGASIDGESATPEYSGWSLRIRNPWMYRGWK